MKKLKSGAGSVLPGARSLVALSAMLTMLASQSANAAITNDATAEGTYGGNPVNSNTSSESVDVTPAGPALSVSLSIGTPSITAGNSNAHTDGSDTVTFTYVITNTGNVTINDVVPVDAGPLFDAVAGAGSMGSFSLVEIDDDIAPGESVSYTVTYTLAQVDAIRAADITNGITNVASATGTPAAGTLTNPTSNTVQATITGYSDLDLLKTAVLNDVAPGGAAGTADINDTITYTYVATNNGTRTLTNVQVEDDHEAGTIIPLGVGGITSDTLSTNGPLGAGASPDDLSPTNGVWGTLAGGAAVTFTYTHTVNPTEFNNQ
jgi:uncharacterized repeat protein (TIGR01451 family)